MQFLDAGFRGREKLGDLCTERGIVKAIEIGTDTGVFAEKFLKRWPNGHTLWCVDPYEPYEWKPWDRTPDIMMAAARLVPFGDQVHIVRRTSAQFNNGFDEKRLGFVYIDGDHEYEPVRQDIELWWPKLRPGGILAGHDLDRFWKGVRQAVTEFFEPKGIDVYRIGLAKGEGTYSWYAFKPES
jgi:predicted O-methyltransferase YrrM